MTQKTSRNGDSGHKPLETSPMIFTTSPDQQERQLNSVHFTSQDLYGDGRPYSFRPYNQQADAAADSYRNLTEGNDETSHLVDHQNRKITPIAMSDTYLSKPYDIHHYTASSDFFANNLSMQPDLLKATDTVISRRYDEKDGSRLKNEGLLHTSSSNFLFGDKTKLFGEHQHHQITKESDLIDQRIQQIDSMIHNVNELNKKISAKSARNYDRDLFKSKYRSSYVQDTANLSGKKSPNIFDTLDTKISQIGLSKPKSDVYQSSLNPRSSSIRTMGYALEVLRNDMKHNFLTEVDDFIDKRLTPPRKKRSDRLKTLENEIEHIRKIKESDFQKIPTLASEIEDLGIHMSNLRVSRANRRAPQVGVEEIPKNRVYVTEMYKDGSKYEGELQGGLRHGQGKLTYSDGTWFDGTWMLDRIEGYGAFYYESNKVSYEGEWKNNKREGNGVMYNEQVTHIGEGYLDRPFDRSENTWEKYEGEFKNDDWHGSGRLSLSNGDVFQGTFKKGVIQGKGTYMTGRGEMVIGEWQENTLIRIY